MAVDPSKYIPQPVSPIAGFDLLQQALQQVSQDRIQRERMAQQAEQERKQLEQQAKIANANAERARQQAADMKAYREAMLDQGDERMKLDRAREARGALKELGQAAYGGDQAQVQALLPSAQAIPGLEVSRGQVPNNTMAAPAAAPETALQMPGGGAQAPSLLGGAQLQGPGGPLPAGDELTSLLAGGLKAPEAAAPEMLAPTTPEEEERANQQLLFRLQGQGLGGIDMGNIGDEKRKAVEGPMQALLDLSTDPAERAVRQAAGGVAGAASRFQTPAEAVEFAQKASEGQLGRIAAGKRAETVSTGIQGRSDRVHDVKARQFVEGVVRDRTRKLSTDMGLKQWTETESNARRAVKSLALNDPFADRAAIAEQINALIRGVPSNKDTELIMQSGGVGAQLETELRRWVDDGRMSDAMRKGIMIMSNKLIDYAQDRRRDIAGAAQNAIANDVGILGLVGEQEADAYGRQVAKTLLSTGYAPDDDGGPPAASVGEETDETVEDL